MTSTTRLSEYDIRLSKRQQLLDMGIAPYAQKWDKKQMISDLIAHEGETMRDIETILISPTTEYSTAGRVTLYRSHGKLSFAKLMDESAEIQLMFHRDQCHHLGGALPDDLTAYKFIEKFIDVGDIIGVRGELFVTHKGELTLFVSEFQLLSKALKPLGDKWHGIGEDNQERAYRQRYLDMIFNRETLERMKLRSRFLKVIRDFYDEHGFMEIETPVLGNSASGAAAAPFITHHNDFDQEMYLRISPETNLKKATVGMLEKIFEVAKDFRNEGSDPSHIQEFTMIEHYAAYRNHEDNMRFTEQMFDYVFDKIPALKKLVIVVDKQGNTKEVNFQTPRQRVDYISQIKADSGIDVSAYGAGDEEKLRADIIAHGHSREGLDKQATATMIDYLYKKVTRPKIVGPAFIVNYPKTMQPLARQSDQDANIVEQRQLLINGREVIKAYCELVDPVIQQANFDEQAAAVAAGDDEATKGDDDFVQAMEYGMPCQSGRGMGIDRIFSLLTEQQNIRDVVLFPLMKPEHNAEGGILPDGRQVVNDEGKKEQEAITSSKKIVESIANNNSDTGVSISSSTVQAAESIAAKYLSSTLLHCQQVAGCMRYFAKKLGKSEGEQHYRYVVGLLHDVDWDAVDKNADLHTGDTLQQIVQELGLGHAENMSLQNDIRSHYQEKRTDEQYALDTDLRKYLISIDELSGLLYAYARMRGGSFDGMEVSGVMKKIKDVKFAAGVSRDHVRYCETALGISLEEFVGQMIEAMQAL